MKYDEITEQQEKESKTLIKYLIIGIILTILLIFLTLQVNAETQQEKKVNAFIKNQQVTIVLNSHDNMTFQVLPNQTFQMQNTYKIRFNNTLNSTICNFSKITDKTNYTLIKNTILEQSTIQKQEIRDYFTQTILPSQTTLENLRTNITNTQIDLNQCHEINTANIQIINSKDKDINITGTALAEEKKTKQQLLYLNMGIVLGIFCILGVYITLLNKKEITQKRV